MVHFHHIKRKINLCLLKASVFIFNSTLKSFLFKRKLPHQHTPLPDNVLLGCKNKLINLQPSDGEK